MNVLPDVYICFLKKKSAPLLPVDRGQHKIYACGKIANSQRIVTEIDESGTVAKIRI